MARRTLLQRFQDKYVPEVTSGCFLWTAATHHQGYGQIWENGKTVRAHRLAYRLFKGPVPDGLCVLHTCDTPACVNIDHLFLGTHADNVADRVNKGRDADRKGVENGRAKLTEGQVLEIRATTGTLQEISSQYRIDPSNVSYIKSRKSWAHL